MLINIRSQIRRLSKRTNLLSVIKEAVVNSFQSGSTEIKLILHRENKQIDLLDRRLKISGLDIIDNGAGFNQKNRDSFSEYGSEFKLTEGCKGVGRLCFLKVFESVLINSFLFDTKQKITVDFTDKFKKSDFRITPENKILQNQTTICLRKIKDSYEKNLKIDEIKNEIYNHILPLLYLNPDKKIKIIITDDGDERVIKAEDLPDFESETFEIKELLTNDKNKISFTLHYSFVDHIRKAETVLNDFYCANKRAVCRFKDKEFKINPLNGTKTTLLLVSNFFDKRVNDERSDFDIHQKKVDLVTPLSWDIINNKLREVIKKILYTKYPKLETANQDVLKSIREDNLHLIDYLRDVDSLGGMIDSDIIIEKAEKVYTQEKITFKKELKNKEINSSDIIRKASNLAGKELIEYVLTRDKIISQLETFHQNDEKLEESIHDLILKKGQDTSELSPLPLSENNIWLIDDKFMSFCYAASDKTIRTACRKIGGISKSARRPDVSIFFRNEQDNHNAVIVELKSFSVDAKKKFDGLRELREYAEEFKKQKSLNTIWYYLITKIDEEFENQLINDDYKLLFSNKDKTYFKYFDKMSLYLFVMSSETLIADAKARNKTFIDIVRRNCGLKA